MIHGRRWKRLILAVFGALLLIPSAVYAESRTDVTNSTGAGDAHLAQTPAPEMPAGALQALVDAGAPGATVNVPPGIYRETVTIDKPLTLAGAPGAEIRGSDVWNGGWTHRDGYWYRGDAPDFGTTGEWCREGSNGRCNWADQVFLDGVPLLQVQGQPDTGQFAINGQREVVLADDPSGRTVEVTTRRAWVVTASHDVTIQGMTMRHAADRPHEGALSNSGHANWTVQDSKLFHAHMAVISLRDAGNAQVLNNEIGFGGRLGIHSWNVSDSMIRGNFVHSNNREVFEDGWEAGGMKLSKLSRTVVTENEVAYNDGPGIWCDVGCQHVEISRNRVHDNRRYGILYEISSHGRVVDNRAWENGWGFSDWGFGAGILCQNCRDTEFAGNVVAWNADGISIMSQHREGFTDVVNNHVHDNVIILTTDWSQNTYMLAWLEDWSGRLTAPSSNNRGANNRYFHATPDGAFLPFTWGQYERYGIDDLAGFNATPGEDNGRLISHEEARGILEGLGMPVEPQARD